MKQWLLPVILPILIVACTEVPVKEVQKCSKVVKVELASYFFGKDPDFSWIVLTLEDGAKKRLDIGDYKRDLKIADDQVYKYVPDTAPSLPFMLRVKIREMGKEYCRTAYELIK